VKERLPVLINNSNYISAVSDIKAHIKHAQRKVLISANAELFTLYWNIGKVINKYSVWGNKFIENLARDIKLDFPGAKGYSIRNLKYMAKFARTFPDFEIVQLLTAQLTWTHSNVLLDKIKDLDIFLWYAERNGEAGWTVETLKEQIESSLYERQALTRKASNFQKRSLA